MKITKKLFIEEMVNHKTTFFGTTKRLFSKDEVFCIIENFFNPEDKTIVEERTCVARSKDLVFSGGSHLNLTSGMEYFKYEYHGGYVLVAHDTWVTMYYGVRKS